MNIPATLLICILTLTQLNGIGQENLKSLLDKQVQAFNDHHVDGLTAGLHSDFVWYGITSDALLEEVRGVDKFGENMRSYFESYPDVNSKIISFTISGNRIAFEEQASWTMKGESKSQKSMGVYEFKDGLIYRVWYFY